MKLKRRWVLITAIVIAVLLIAGTIGLVYAQDNSTTKSDTPENTLMARVATILGIDQQTLEDAFTQAREEIDQEALTDRLQKMVDNGEITQEQADQYQQWWTSRPDIPQLQMGGIRGPEAPGGHGPRPGQMPPPSAPEQTPTTTATATP